MKASNVWYGDLTDKKVKGISNGLKFKQARAYVPQSVFEIRNKTSRLIDFILNEPIERIKPEMHPWL